MPVSRESLTCSNNACLWRSRQPESAGDIFEPRNRVDIERLSNLW